MSTNQGMTYVELIVVLGIFVVMSSVAIFNYGSFQSKVDMRNLANDVALKIVEAQKAALSGKLPSVAYDADWNPSYGVYFDRLSSSTNFTYFTDVNSDATLNAPYEALEVINITKGNRISKIDAYYAAGTNVDLHNVTLTFVRPNSEANITSTDPLVLPIAYIQITVLSPKGNTSIIKIYPSGRIEIG